LHSLPLLFERSAAERSPFMQRQRRMLDMLLGGMEATRRRLVQVDEQLDALARGSGTVDAAALQAALEELLLMLKEKIDDTNGLRLNETVGERASRWREIAELRASLGMSPQAARLQASSAKHKSTHQSFHESWICSATP
jgi:hypothetical protein